MSTQRPNPQFCAGNVAQQPCGSAGLVRLLDRKEIARLADVSVATIKRDAKRGRIAEIRFNARRVRYHPDAVAQYLRGKYPAESYAQRCRQQNKPPNDER